MLTCINGISILLLILEGGYELRNTRYWKEDDTEPQKKTR
jgi:hypothetical protein